MGFMFFSVFASLMMFGTYSFLPIGIPPLPEDPNLVKIAPEECLFYGSWAGVDSSSNGQTATEKWLRQHEIKLAIGQIKSSLNFLAKQSSTDLGLVDFFTDVYMHPSVFYVTDVKLKDFSPTSVDAVFVCRLGETTKKNHAFLEKTFADSDFKSSAITIDGNEFQVIELADKDELISTIIWGQHDGYTILATGKNSVEQLLENWKTPAPKWLQDIRARGKIPRLASTSYLNSAALQKKFLDDLDPFSKGVLKELGINDLKSISWTSGLDEKEFVARTMIDIDGNPTGLFSLIDGKKLSVNSFSRIDKNAPVVLSTRLSADKILLLLEKTFGDSVPVAIKEAEDYSKVDIRNGLIGSLGDQVTIYSHPDEGGLLTGWLLTIQIKDTMSFSQAMESVVAFANKQDFGDGQPVIKRTNIKDGQSYFTFRISDDFVPFQFSWGLTRDGQLAIGLYPQSVRAHLQYKPVKANQISRDERFKMLFNPNGLDKDAKLVSLSAMDTTHIIQALYPLIKNMLMRMSWQELMDEKVLKFSDLPSTKALNKYNTRAITGVYRTTDGFHVITRRTLPGGNLGAVLAMAATGQFTTAVSQRKVAARLEAANNMRQIGIAMHTYHDSYRALPSAYTKNADGKKMLSWRVQILPFIEQSDLFDQFNHDEPWDSEHNKKLIAKMPPVYQCPRVKTDEGKTIFLASSGVNGMLIAPTKSGKNPKGLSLETIRDGTSNTILLIEAPAEMAVEWTKPSDFDHEIEGLLKKLKSNRKTGEINVMFGDCSVQMLPDSTKIKTWKGLFNRQDGKTLDRGEHSHDGDDG